jgi:hypothetical protein
MGRDEEADADTSAGRVFDSPDHSAVCDVRVDDIERLARVVEQARDPIRDRPVAPGRIVENERRDAVGPRLQLGEERRDLGCLDRAAEPTKAREEHQLELRDDRAGDAEEEVMEAAVLEVVLDTGSADQPTRPSTTTTLRWSIVAELGQVPPSGAVPSQRPERRSKLGRAHDAYLDACGREPVVERLRAPLGIGATAVDDEPDRHALCRLRDQRLANASPTTPGLKPNWLMCTEDDAEAMSSSIGGLKFRPSTWTSTEGA